MAKKKKRKKTTDRTKPVDHLAKPPSSGPSMEADIITQAEELAGSGRGPEAIEILARAIKDNPSDVAALAALARMQMNRRNFMEAAVAYHEVVLINQDDATSFNGLATALAMAGRREEARRFAKRAVDLVPDNPLYLANLGKLHMMDGGWHLAMAFLERALAVSPEDERWKYLQTLNQCRQYAEDNPIITRNLTPGDVSATPAGLDEGGGEATMGHR